jgi:hypothetical protein
MFKKIFMQGITQMEDKILEIREYKEELRRPAIIKEREERAAREALARKQRDGELEAARHLIEIMARKQCDYELAARRPDLAYHSTVVRPPIQYGGYPLIYGVWPIGYRVVHHTV